MMQHFDSGSHGSGWIGPRPRGPRKRLAAVVAVLSIVAAVPGLWAQTNATIEGTVTDPDGAPLPGVQVSVAGEQVSRTVTSNDAGVYRIPVLPPGMYRLTASLESFNTKVIEDLELYINQTLRLDLALELGAFEQTIMVTGERLLLNKDSADTGHLVTPEEIEKLPVNGRDYIDLVGLVPGVTVNRNEDEGNDEETPIMGERAGNAVFLVDGMPNRDEFGGGPATQFNQDTISQFEVLTDGFKAEFGHGSGGIVNVITKSGTNDLKGLGFVFYRNDSLSSSNSLDPDADVPELERFDYGFTLGGAILKDKVFFFGSAERISEDRQLDFTFPSGTPDFIEDRERGYDELTEDRNTRLFLKLTEQLGTRHRLTQQVSYTDRDLANWLPLSEATSLPSTRRSFVDERLTIGLRDESLLGNENNPLVLEAYVQYRDEPSRQFPSYPEAGPLTAFSIFSATDTFLILGDLGSVAFGADQGEGEIDQEYTGVGASLSKFLNNHTIKGGADYLRTHVDGVEVETLYNQLLATEENFLEYGPLHAGLLIPLFTGGLTDEDSQIRLRNDYTGLYLQDDWKIHPRVTLNIGLRWDYDSEFEDSDNFGPRLGLAWSVTDKTVVRGSWGLYYDRFRMGLARNVPAFGGASLLTIQPLAYPQLFNILTSMFPAFLGQCISPNQTDAEIAASGAGCPFGPLPYYGYDHLNSVVAPGFDPVPLGTVVTIDNVQELTGYTPDEYIAQVTAAAPHLIPGFEWFWSPGGLLAHTGVPGSEIPVTLDPAFETPYTQAYHLGVQQMLGSNWMVSVDYHHRDFENLLGTRYTNLAFESRVIGAPIWEDPNPAWGIVGYGPWYDGEYDAVSIGLTKRFSHGYAVSASYTYTDAEDNLYGAQLGGDISLAGIRPSDNFVGVPPVVTDPVTGQTNESGSFWSSTGAYVPQAGVYYNGPDLDRGPSSLALEHTFLVYGSVILGWQLELSGIFRYQSGYPFSRGTLAGVDIDGDRNITGRDYEYQHNSFQAPDYSSLDLRLARPFSIGGDVVLTPIIEVFNVFNEQNPAAVEDTPDMAIPFGEPLQVLPGREGQLGLRIEF